MHTDLFARPEWLEVLPPLRGRLRPWAPLAATSWFKVGGRAEVLFKPADLDDLRAAVAACPEDVPITVVGAASNLLIRDGGIPGLVIRLGAGFARIEIEGDQVEAGAAAADYQVALRACEAGLGGLTFLSGVPGRIGGGISTNAGAYGSELAEVVQSMDIVDEGGRLRRLSVDQLGLSYRSSELPDRSVVVKVRLQGRRSEPAVLYQRLEAIKQARMRSQPVRARCCGSAFANPVGADKAWQLIERSGCRGWRYGGAQISPQHCNFLVNTGSASASELETLGKLVQQRVYERERVWLRWEIKRIGIP